MAEELDTSTLTEEFRQRELERGRQSFWYFVTAICGQIAEDPETGESTLCDFHYDLCSFLQGLAPHFPFKKAVVCCARLTGKSVFVRLYALWRCLYIVNFSVLLVSNSADNAKKLHFLKIVDLLTSSRRAEYLRWLYQHRFPQGMAGTNSEQLKLVQTDPQADVAISYAGIESKLEGKHPDLVLIDDSEGADSEASLVPNEDSYRLWQRCQYLPRYPARSQIILVGTPWGHKPIVYRLRRQVNWKVQADNETSEIKFFWRPIRNPDGSSVWPDRYPQGVIDEMLKEPMSRTQLLLEESEGDVSLFDMALVRAAYYTWLTPDKNLISYKGWKFDPDNLGADGYVRPEPTDAVVRLKQLRYFVHMDPKHRTAEKMRRSLVTPRPAHFSLVVVGVAPDCHAFLVDYFVDVKDALDLDGQAEALFRSYRKWCPALVTYESVGAQFWLKSHVETRERENPNWAAPTTSGFLVPQGIRLPRLSIRLQEDDKTTESKEWIFRERLSPWLNHGTLHLRSDQAEPVRQIEGVMNDGIPVDIVDALAQGPLVWKPSAADIIGRDFEARRRYVREFVQKGGSGGVARTGWRSPKWRKGA